jgi:hypothetical protein
MRKLLTSFCRLKSERSASDNRSSCSDWLHRVPATRYSQRCPQLIVQLAQLLSTLKSQIWGLWLEMGIIDFACLRHNIDFSSCVDLYLTPKQLPFQNSRCSVANARLPCWLP